MTLQTRLDRLNEATDKAVEQIRYLAKVSRLNLTTHSENLKLIPEVKSEMQEINDRLWGIENCLKQAGLMDEVIKDDS